MTENQQSPSSTFYAVAWGNQRGVFTNWKDAQSALKGFPSPVYKKFSDRNQADEFLKKSQPESTSIEADENWAGNFYVVARGRVLGIFKDFDTVKKNIAGFPKPMHKKFTTFVEAKQYFEKFAEGKVEEKTPKRKATHEEDKEENEVEGKGNDVNDVKPVARKRTSGKVGETDESDTGEQLDQMTEETNKEAKITHQSEEAIETGASSFEEEKPVKSQDDQHKDERKEAEDTGTAIAEDYEPSQKHPKTEE